MSVNAVIQTIEEIYRYQENNSGNVPSCLVKTPADWHDLAWQLVHANPKYTLGHSFNDGGKFTFRGIPVVICPFVNDPLFKQLQAMAVLAGTEIRYQTYQQEVLGARFTTSCGGWAYSPAQQCLGGESYLYEVDEAGLPLKKPYCFAAAKEQLHV